MKTHEEFKKKVFDAIIESQLNPHEVVEKDSQITLSIIKDDDEIPVNLKNFRSILEEDHLRYNSSICSQKPIINISVFYE